MMRRKVLSIILLSLFFITISSKFNITRADLAPLGYCQHEGAVSGTTTDSKGKTWAWTHCPHCGAEESYLISEGGSSSGGGTYDPGDYDPGDYDPGGGRRWR